MECLRICQPQHHQATKRQWMWTRKVSKSLRERNPQAISTRQSSIAWPHCRHPLRISYVLCNLKTMTSSKPWEIKKRILRILAKMPKLQPTKSQMNMKIQAFQKKRSQWPLSFQRPPSSPLSLAFTDVTASKSHHLRLLIRVKEIYQKLRQNIKQRMRVIRRFHRAKLPII